MPYTYQKNAAGEFLCPHCGVTKARQNTMHYHLKRHEDHLPFQCDICKKEFLHASVLALHKAARHPAEGRQDEPADENSSRCSKGFACPSCKFSSLTRANCIIHYLRRHCNVLTSGTTCPKCEKICNSRTALMYHIGSSLECHSGYSVKERGHLEGLKNAIGPFIQQASQMSGTSQ